MPAARIEALSVYLPTHTHALAQTHTQRLHTQYSLLQTAVAEKKPSKKDLATAGNCRASCLRDGQQVCAVLQTTAWFLKRCCMRACMDGRSLHGSTRMGGAACCCAHASAGLLLPASFRCSFRAGGADLQPLPLARHVPLIHTQAQITHTTHTGRLSPVLQGG